VAAAEATAKNFRTRITASRRASRASLAGSRFAPIAHAPAGVTLRRISNLRRSNGYTIKVYVSEAPEGNEAAGKTADEGRAPRAEENRRSC
jgi:hypothetical protein